MKKLMKKKIIKLKTPKADYNYSEDREGNNMLWCGYVNSKDEIIINRYFNQFDMENVKRQIDRVKVLSPFWAEDREKAKEKASRLCQS